MAIQYINTGSSANAGNGDSLRSAFIKVNNNFAYLSTASFGSGGDGYTGSAGTNGYTGSAGSAGTNGYTGSQGDIGYTGSAGIGIVQSGDFGHVAFYNSTGTTLAEAGALTYSPTAQNIYVGNSVNTNASLWVQRDFYSAAFGRGITFSQHHSTPDAVNFNFYRTRGTAANPTAVQNGDDLGEIAFFGHNGTTSSGVGGLSSIVDGSIVNGRFPSKIVFSSANTSTIAIGAELSSSSTWKIDKLGQLTASNNYIAVSTNLVPDYDNIRDLGSYDNQWHSLYVSSSTVYINRTPVTIDNEGNFLVNGSSVLGTPGYTGSRGNLGYTGSKGDTGSAGSQGNIGYSGSKGDLGYTGSRGVDGYAGSKGDIGYTGSEGTPGQQGNRGYTGSEGAQGTPGLQGLTGAQGINIVLVGSTTTVTTSTVGLGTAGQGWINTTDGDVYFWNTGTQLWENIGPIVGPQGDLGYTGSQGGQGDIGLTGDPGYTGSQGANGYDGSQGETGYTGSQGELGYTGSQGDLGYVGSQGETGYTGSQGELGYVGSQGDIGYTGSTGSRGFQGYTGSVGFVGSQGDVGYTGSLGYTGSKGDQGEPGGNANTGNFVFTASQVSVSNDGDITLVTNANTWTFSADGVLTLPSGNTRIGDFNGLDAIVGSTGTGVGVFSQGPSGFIALEWIDNNENIGTTASTQVAAVIVNSPIASTSGTVQIATGLSSGPTADNIWEFGNTGRLTLPNGTAIGSFDSPNGIELKAFAQHDYVELSYNSDQYLWADAVGAYIATNWTATSHTWTFAKDGVMSTPGNLIPNTDLAYDLGSPTQQWRSLYVGTGTVYIGGVALGVNRDNYVTVDGNPIITVNTAGNITIQGDSILTPVTVSAFAPPADVEGNLWYNNLDGRTYVAYAGQWVDANPTVVPAPETYLDEITIDGSTLNINGSTLTISNTGTLLINGTMVTGSGGGGDIYGATITASATDPLTSTGTLWFNTVEGRTYLKYNNQWVDVNPTVVPQPSTYLDEITIDGSTINMNGSTLAINTAGVLLVNGSEVTGGSGWQLTSSTAVVSLGSDGTLTLPDGGVISEVGGAFSGAIRLEPWGASSSTQALVIYPTVGVDGNHIHLTAGGGGTDLYLGDDDQYVKVDHSGTIVVGTLGATTSTWTFGTDGMLTLPAAVGTLPNLFHSPGLTIGAGTAGNTVWEFGTDGVLTLPADTPIIKGGGTGTDVTVIAGTEPVDIFEGSLEFIGSGTLLLSPGVAVGGIGDTGNGSFTIDVWVKFSEDPATHQQYILGSNFQNGFSLFVGDGQATPSATKITVDCCNVSNTQFEVPALTTNTWYHIAVARNSSGIASVWVNGVRSTTGAVGLGYYGSPFTGLTNQIGSWSYNNTTQMLGNVGQVRIVTGNNVYNPNDSTITVPTADLQTITGTQLLLLMRSIDQYGDDTENNTLSVYSMAGSTTLPTWTTDAPTTEIPVTWTFGQDGSVTFPDATVQTTAYTGTVAYSNVTGAPAVVNKTSGSWTLAPGANTVSITVTPGGNYQMWVNGNIPNGIVTWNATVSTSNTNVPVVGVQYGWYYAAGNALVLTSMPNQIVGTAGSISTATVATTTSNVFTFGITNNSGSSQVINWGYTTL